MVRIKKQCLFLVFLVDSPRDTELSPCGGVLAVDAEISVSSNSNPEISMYEWFINDTVVSTDSVLVITEDMLGSDVQITCSVMNSMRNGDAIGMDNATCTYTILRK